MIILACSIAGNNCEEHEVRVDSYFSCAITGQAAQAKWLKRHPGKYIKRWSCDPRQLSKV